MAADRIQRRLAAILAADVVGYIRLLEPDEAGVLACLRISSWSCIDSEVVANDHFDALARETRRDIHRKLNRKLAFHGTQRDRGMPGL
jgi:hypothetical protein